MNPPVELRDAGLRFHDRVLWEHLDLSVEPGEFLAVLGPNGTGKTSLLKVLLGQHALFQGTARINGRPARRGNSDVGYVPQQKGLDEHVPMRGRDMVRMGINGHRWGPGLPSRRLRARVDELIAQVGAEDFADAPAGVLSGGERQRLRVAAALGSDPSVLLCDEPLLSLDLHHQQVVSNLLHRQAAEHDTTVLFVTHEINPVLPYVDRVLYLAGGRFRIGTPREVINTETLSELYRSRVRVVEVDGQLLIVGGDEGAAHHHEPPADAAPEGRIL